MKLRVNCPGFYVQITGVAALRAGLAHAAELGLERVLLYADTDNPASWRTIERCDGCWQQNNTRLITNV